MKTSFLRAWTAAKPGPRALAEALGRAPALGLALAVGTTLAACGTTGPGIEDLTELARNRARWSEVRPPSYRYAVRRDCFCGEEARGPVRVSVSGRSVVGRVYVDSGDPVPTIYEELFPTVDGLFAAIADAIERDAARIDVVYDSESGVPLEISIDYELNVADEELGFRVSEAVSPLP